MSFREELEQQGQRMSRWPSYFLLLAIVPVLILAQPHSLKLEASFTDRFEDVWKALCCALALFGAAIRCFAIAQAPPNARGTSTTRKSGRSLETTGIYSIVRHPLYAANSLIFLSILLEMKVWWLFLLGTLLCFIYFERIIAAEERELRQRFGAAFDNWAKKTPAIIPSLRLWMPPAQPLSVRHVLGCEHNTLLLIAATFTAFEYVDARSLPPEFGFDAFWLGFVAIAGASSLILRLISDERHGIVAMPQLRWNLDPLGARHITQYGDFGVSPDSRSINYPVRLLRYWFMWRYLRQEQLALRRPMSICEIGLDSGQMRAFTLTATRGSKFDGAFEPWHGVDCAIQQDRLARWQYAKLIEADIEGAALELPQSYDALILLHVLEHLAEPEKALGMLVKHVAAGGIVIGGFPVLPHFLVRHRERTLRRKAAKYGHVSAFSVNRLTTMAEQLGLEVKFVSGAYLMRKRGFFLENYSWWIRFNLLFGALFPSFPGELYWILRKPSELPGRSDDVAGLGCGDC